MEYFTEVEQIILKFVKKHKLSKIVQIIMRKNKAGSIIFSWFQTILQSYSNQNSVVLALERYIDQGTEWTPRNKYNIHKHLMNDKGAKNIRWREAISSINGVGKMGQPHERKNKTRLQSYTT